MLHSNVPVLVSLLIKYVCFLASFYQSIDGLTSHGYYKTMKLDNKKHARNIITMCILYFYIDARIFSYFTRTSVQISNQQPLHYLSHNHDSSLW